MGGKSRGARSKSGANMIFECADCTFGGVATVVVQGGKLEVNVLFAELFMHYVGALIVNNVESKGYTIMT